ncbi:energy-coupling factor ABC transporter ATP-binding protein [Mitsuokella multacida]|uniref:energy-coupling factor ABC transporter ATP-binding protein n=1 Tax=Mitsuokella multacida TaxID=52226 RepID=UPI003FA24A61
MDRIELKHVTFSYTLAENKALDDVSFTFERGRFYGVIGENGGGKTTLCNLLRGLIPNFFKGEMLGQVLYDGTDMKELDVDALSVDIGYVFQNPFTQISGVKKTVFEEVALGLENLGVPPEKIVKRVIDVLKLLEIEHLALNNPTELSGGQRQRVAFASIIVMDPDILVIDEPTSQLDPEGSRRIFDIIETLKKRNKTIILVEHKINMIAMYCDAVLVMKDGKLVRSGSAQEVLSDVSLPSLGVRLPEAAQLAYDLADKGMPLSGIPIPDEACCRMIQERWGIHGGN